MTKISTAFRLSPAAREILSNLSRHHGVSQADVIELVLRREARREGLMPSHDEEGHDEVPVTLHTIGYQLRSQTALVTELQNAGVHVLIDVRETPWSYQAHFSKGKLAACLDAHGIRYVHAAYAGNPKALRRAATSHADCLRAFSVHLDANPTVLDRLADEVFDHHLSGRKVALFCYERHPLDCHRAILASALAKREAFPLQVVHLATEGAPRFTSEQILLS